LVEIHEQQLRVVIDTVVDGVILIDAIGTIEIFNKACETLFGYRSDEVVGKNVRMLMPEPYKREHDGYLRHYIETGERRIIGIGREAAGLRKDGTEFPMELSVGEMQHDDRRVFVGVIRDITSRKYAERQLEAANLALEKELHASSQAEQRFQAIIRAAPTPMIIAAPDGRITLANEAAEALFGYDSNSIIGLSVDMLVPDSARQGHRQLRETYLRTPSKRAMGANRDLFARHRDGHLIPVEVGLTPLGTEANRLVVAAFIDLSERLAAQRALEEHTAALERSNRDLDDFAYAAAHDLRAPLRGIEQLASFIDEDARDLLPEASRADLDILRQRVQRMQGLLTGLLDYSRIGRTESQSELIDTKAAIADIAELYVPPDRFKLIVQEDLPSVMAPREAFDMVFRNLFMNAVKHHDRETGEIRVEGQGDDAGVNVTVTDDGPGIPFEYAERIFKVFQTLEARDEVEATGIGLSLVQKTMLTQGGTVELIKRTGRGAAFRLFWPNEATAKGGKIGKITPHR
tara:strand:- start:4007 stop:5560 length:1554 start_codon:yes stop_codon:yes gene_type:complete